VRSFRFFPRVVVFRIDAPNIECVKGKTTTRFDVDDIRVLGRPFIITPHRVLLLAVVNKNATAGFCDLLIQVDGDTWQECILEAAVLIE
jgi:hypothetical protein